MATSSSAVGAYFYSDEFVDLLVYAMGYLLVLPSESSYSSTALKPFSLASVHKKNFMSILGECRSGAGTNNHLISSKAVSHSVVHTNAAFSFLVKAVNGLEIVAMLRMCLR